MRETRKESGWPIVVGVVLLLLLLALGVYVGGYYALSESHEVDFGSNAPMLITMRTFNYRWQVIAYRPMAQVENMISGNLVVLQQKDYPDGQ